MSEPKLCDKDGMCRFLEERLTDGGKGFRAIHTIKIDPTAESLPMMWRGVSYHDSAKDRGLLLNFCPFCGGKPGDLASRDTPNPSLQGTPLVRRTLQGVVGRPDDLTKNGQ